jgi:hypothetical protein
MEKVWTGRSGLSCETAKTEKADRNKAHKIWACRRMSDLLTTDMKQKILVYRRKGKWARQEISRDLRPSRSLR